MSRDEVIEHRLAENRQASEAAARIGVYANVTVPGHDLAHGGQRARQAFHEAFLGELLRDRLVEVDDDGRLALTGHGDDVLRVLRLVQSLTDTGSPR